MKELWMEHQVGIKKVAVVCVLRCVDQFLLIKRKYPPHVGKYSPVGGKIGPYETPQEAVIREVYEEVGVQLVEVKLAGILTESSPTKYNWILYVYVADVDFFEPPECREGALKWVIWQELSPDVLPETDRFIYEYITGGQFFVFDAVYDQNVHMLRMREEISGQVVFVS
jgi:8-oxo-dGTP diphosphatase